MQFFKHPLIKENVLELREFQELIAKSVLEKGSTLVVLPTAFGKTIIAVIVIAELLLKEPEKKVLVLAPTKPLALQHKERFLKFFKFSEEEIVLLTGETKPEKRALIIQKAKIICATPQTIENDLKKGLSLKEFQLLVVDEAHRSVKEYSYVFVAKEFKRQCNGLILALTASPGSEKERIQDICRNLFIQNIEVRTAADESLKKYSKEIEFEWLKVELPFEFQEIISLLKEFIKEKTDKLREIEFLKIPRKTLSRKELLELQKKISGMLAENKEKNAFLFNSAIIIAELLKANHALLLIETQGINALKDYIEKIELNAINNETKSDIVFIKNEKIIKVKEKLNTLVKENLMHPKVIKLIELIKEFISKEKNARIIVFNHYRSSVESLVKILKENNIKAESFVGQAKKPKSKGLTQKEQAKKIKEFSEGNFNVLVATSVAEEGIDIPSCDLVILFEPVPSEIRQIQRIGRTGRIRKGKAIMLIAKNTRDEAFYWSAKQKERKMYSHLKELMEEKKMKQQATLKEFIENKEHHILIDSRESASNLILLLKEKGINVSVVQLDVGDYVIDNSIVIERKTTTDFLTSIIDGRLFNQLQAMNANYDKPLLIIEGHPNELFSLRNIHPNAIIGALAAITLNFRIPILFSKDINQTAEFIYVITKRAIEGKTNDIRLRVEKPQFSLAEQQQFVIESLPGIGPRTAKALLKKFGSIKKIFNATEKELMETENIGEKKAKIIKKLIEAKYNEENNKEN